MKRFSGKNRVMCFTCGDWKTFLFMTAMDIMTDYKATNTGNKLFFDRLRNIRIQTLFKRLRAQICFTWTARTVMVKLLYLWLDYFHKLSKLSFQ